MKSLILFNEQSGRMEGAETETVFHRWEQKVKKKENEWKVW